MNIERQQEFVKAFHYDSKAPDQEIEPDMKVGLSPLQVKEGDFPENDSLLGARVEFRLPFKDCILTGMVSQVNHIVGRKIENPEDLAPEEIQEVVRPLLVLIERLTYEVTEIALDQPGIEVNFAQE